MKKPAIFQWQVFLFIYIADLMIESIREFWILIQGFTQEAWDVFTTPVLHLGNSEISLGTIIYFILAFILLSHLSKRFRNLLVNKILFRANFEIGTRNSIGTISRFMVLLIGSILIVQSAGIDLSTLSLLAGALGVGIGFGLQNITNNFISGIIILFEKPVKVGDRVVVGNIEGDVINISVRATTVLTNDNISVIVPNSEFISSQVINWSHNDRNIRYQIPVGVSYDEDPERIREILLLVAEESPHTLSRPKPYVFFDKFADSSLDFTLAVWTATHTDKPLVLKSELYFEIFKKFRENGISIPYPQRDIHIKSRSS